MFWLHLIISVGNGLKPLKLKKSESRSVILTLCDPMDLHSPWSSPGENTGGGRPFPSLGDLPNPEIEPRSPTLQVDSLPAEPLRKQGES